MSTTMANALRRLRSHPGLQTPGLVPIQQDALDLTIDHPSQGLASAVKMAAVDALRRGETHYADVPGVSALRETVAAWLSETHGAGDYTPEHVLITAGLQEARFLTLQILAERLGSLAVPAVVHPGVRQALGVRDVAVHTMPTEEALGHLPSPGAIEQALRAGSKVVFLESPSRLTGAIYTPDQVRTIAGLAQTHEAFIIWDQGLAPWVTPGLYTPLLRQAQAADRVAVIGELWPGAGLESWHIGYVGAPPSWLEPMRIQKQIMSICTNTAVQYAALAAADGFEPLKANLLVALEAQKRQTVAELAGSPITLLPSATANLLALRVPDPAALQALQQAGFRAGDGALFGAPGVVRLAITSDGSSVRAAHHMTHSR